MNKTLRTMLLGCMAVCGTAAWAQNDVTSTYLQNADFSQGTPIDNHLCGYGKDMAGANTTYYGLQDVAGWEKVVISGDDATADFPNSGMGGAVFAYGSEWQLKGNQKTAPAAGPDGAAGNALGFFAVWGCGAYYYQAVTLPAGRYTLTFPMYCQSGTQANESQTGFFPVEGSAYTVAVNSKVGEWASQTVTFTLEAETAGQLRIGYKSTGSGSGANPMLFIDGVKISYVDLNAAHKAAWQEALDAAKAAVANADYANVTGEELTALKAEIAKAEPTTADAYDAAAAALEQATATFIAAKADYDAFKAAQEAIATVPELPYARAEKRPAVANIAPTNAADAKEQAAAIYVAIRAYYESNALAEGVEGAVNMTSSIVNPDATDGNNGWTWTGNKNETRNTESWTDASGKNDYMYFDGGSWGATGWTTTMSQKISLPAGKYLLTAKGRASEEVTLTMAVGEASVELPHVGAAGNVFDRGWNDGYVVFDADGNEAEIIVTATTAGVHQWFSVADFRLMQLEKDNTVEYASAEEIQALDRKAYAVAATHEEGFAAGQYAPYTNVEAFVALKNVAALLERSKLGEEITKTAVEEASASLDALVWTANTEEMNAIFDGQFATTEANTTSGDINLPGWTKIQGIRLLVKDEATDPGLAYTDGKAALFAWGGTTLTYGEQDGYTLPLDIDKPYKLSMKVSGWRDGDMPNDIRVNLSGCEEQVVNDAAVDRVNAAEGNPFAQLEFGFKGFIAQPKLTIYANHHFTIADLELKTISEEEYEVVVGISEAPVAKAAQQQAIYNLAGQRVQKAGKGLYIINGKKVVK